MSDIDREAMNGAIDGVADAMHTLSLRITRLITETRARLDDIDELRNELDRFRGELMNEAYANLANAEANALPDREA